MEELMSGTKTMTGDDGRKVVVSGVEAGVDGREGVVMT